MLLLRQFFVNFGYRAISQGVRLPVEDLLAKWMEKSHLMDLLERLRINCVIDVGANWGGYARMLRRLGYRGTIYSVEPNPVEFAKLSNLFQKDPQWKGFNIALGGENVRKSFHVADESVMSSFLVPREASVAKSLDVEMKRLDTLFPELIAPLQNPRVFLKMDTQGFDLEVVRGAEGCLGQCLGLQSELSVEPLYNGMPQIGRAHV